MRAFVRNGYTCKFMVASTMEIGLISPNIHKNMPVTEFGGHGAAGSMPVSEFGEV